MRVIIYLIGKPGIGKYTIALELAKFGFIICDNQLINNPIFALLNYNGFSKIPEIGWDAIRQIRAAVLGFISKEQDHNYVLTNCLAENEGDRLLYSEVESMALNRGSLFIPIKLLISKEKHLERITVLSRRDRWKTIDPEVIHDQVPLLSIIHPYYLKLNVSNLSPKSAAEQILIHIKKLTS